MISVRVDDPQIAREMIADRKARQIDRYDEVWEDVYVMSPMANNEHQSLATQLSIAIGTIVDWENLGRTLTGANISDRRKDWTRNYRIPDVLVFQNKTNAEDCHTHWYGGPELAIEIVSLGDRTLEKLDFYAKVGTQELLVIDRDPWQLTLYRIGDRTLVPADICRFDQPTPIESKEFPLSFCLNPDSQSLEVHTKGKLVRAIGIRS